MITDRPKLYTKIAIDGMSSFHFTVKLNSKSFPELYAAYKKRTSQIFGNV